MLPPARRELDGVREQVEDDLAEPPLVAATRSTSGASSERELDAVLAPPARAPSRRRARAPRAARTVATSSSTCPASTFDRSRTSLISDSRWLPDERMSSRYSSCFSLISPNSRCAQHLREADDRVQRRAQLVRHVRQELALVPARGLELAVEPSQLVVHPVHVRAKRRRARRGSGRRAGRRSRRRRSPRAAPRSAGSGRSATTRGRVRGRARGRRCPRSTPMKRLREDV